ncbi:MAG: GGDEF domain-containing protein, partial [Colwellia sp.]|nr:GGDEF domain-containing protein [Colwellia sp.]
MSLKSVLLLLVFTLYTKISLAESSADLAEFTAAALKIEKLMDSNAVIAHQQLKRYEDRLAELSLKQQITYHYLLTDIHLLQAQYHIAKDIASLGLSLTKQLSSPSLSIAELLYSRGFANESIGELELATQDYESGLEIAKSFHDKVQIATGLTNLGAIYYLTDRYENSLMVLNDAYNIAKQTTDEELKGSVNSELGILYAYLDRSQQSMSYYQQAYQHYKKANKTILALNALANIATNHLGLKEYEQAIDVYKQIIKESQGAGPSEIMYSTYSGLSWANLKKQQPNPEASYQYLLIAKQFISSIERHDINLQFSSDEAFVLFELDRLDEALVSIAKVEKILTAQMPLGRLKMYTKIGITNLKSKTYFKLGQFKQAYQLQKQRLALTEALLSKEHTRSVSEVRLELEAKQADLHKKVLENKHALQELALNEASAKQQQQRNYLISIAVVALLFAWLLIKFVQGQRRLHKVSSIDMLTGIANRRSLIKRGRQLFNRMNTKKAAFSVLMIDV